MKNILWIAMIIFGIGLLPACDKKTAPEPPQDHAAGVMHDHAESAGQMMMEGTEAAQAMHTCPMHPEVTQAGPGTCPICNMFLEPVEE